MPGRKRPRNDPEVVESRFQQEEERDQGAQGEATEAAAEGGLTEVDKAHKHRSAQSTQEGGQDEYRGEPPSGYFSVAPGKQNAGKR